MAGANDEAAAVVEPIGAPEESLRPVRPRGRERWASDRRDTPSLPTVTRGAPPGVTCPTCGTANAAGSRSASSAAPRWRPAALDCGAPNRPRREVLRRVRHAARACAAGRRPGAPRPPRVPGARTRRPRRPSAASSRVLFADLVGFTTLAEDRDPEAVRELLTRYFDARPRRHRALRRHGREVHRRRGDGRLGRAGRPRGRRRAGRPGRPSTSSTPCARLRAPTARPRAAGRRPDRRGRGHARRRRPGHGRRRPRQHRVAGSSRWRRPGTVLVGEATDARPRRGDRLRAGRRAGRSRARRRRCRRGARCGSSPSAAAQGRTDGLEAPFVGRDDELRLLKDLFHATGARAAGAARLGHRPGRHRQEPARLGVPEVHRRARRDGLLAPAAARRPTARASRFWALGEMVRRRAGLAESDDEATTRDAGRRDARRVRPRRGRAALDRAAPAASCSASRRRRPAAARSCSRRGGRSSSGSPTDGHDGPRLRGPPVGRRRACSTSSTTSSTGRRATRSSSSRSPGRSSSTGGPTGAPGGATSSRSRSSRSPTPAMRELLAGLVPGPAGAGGRARSSTAPTASRCTRSRRSGCWSRTGALEARGRRLPADRRPRRARGPGRRSTRSSPRASTRSTRPTGRCSRTRRCSARRSRVAGAGRRQRRDAPRRWSRGCARSSAARSSRSTRDPRSPERGQYGFVQALIREVAYATLSQARPAGAPPRGGALLRVARRRRAGRRPRHPLPRRLPRRAPRAGGRGGRRPGPDRPAGAPPSGRSPSARTTRRSPTSRRR